MSNKFTKMPKGLEFAATVIALACALLGIVFSFLSYTTGYYIFGEMNSVLVLVFLVLVLVTGGASLFMGMRHPDAGWARGLTLLVTTFLILALIYHLGDRVEGIGNCIVTDYDAGRGGEEAIYLSLVACGILFLGAIINVVGSFGQMRRPVAITAVEEG